MIDETPNDSGDVPHGGYGGPIKRRIEELSDLSDDIFGRMKPVLDLVESVNESRVVFELEVFGYTIIKLKSRVQPKLGGAP